MTCRGAALCPNHSLAEQIKQNAIIEVNKLIFIDISDECDTAGNVTDQQFHVQVSGLW